MFLPFPQIGASTGMAVTLKVFAVLASFYLDTVSTNLAIKNYSCFCLSCICLHVKNDVHLALR